jgi:hypothetical protein
MSKEMHLDEARVSRIEDGSGLFEGEVDLRVLGPEEALMAPSRKGNGTRDARSRKE